TSNPETFDPCLFVHFRKGRFNPGAPTVLVLELRGVLPSPAGRDPQGLEVKAKIMTLLPRFDGTLIQKGTDAAMLRGKGNVISILLSLLESYWRMPLGTGGELSLFRLWKIGQTEDSFLRHP